MGCLCGKQIVNQYGIFNFYVESLNLPSMLLGIVFVVVFYYLYTYCKRNKKLYYQSKISMPQQPAYWTPPATSFPPQAPPWAKPVMEYPLWYPDGKKWTLSVKRGEWNLMKMFVRRHLIIWIYDPTMTALIIYLFHMLIQKLFYLIIFKFIDISMYLQKYLCHYDNWNVFFLF